MVFFGKFTKQRKKNLTIRNKFLFSTCRFAKKKIMKIVSYRIFTKKILNIVKGKLYQFYCGYFYSFLKHDIYPFESCYIPIIINNVEVLLCKYQNMFLCAH